MLRCRLLGPCFPMCLRMPESILYASERCRSAERMMTPGIFCLAMNLKIFSRSFENPSHVSFEPGYTLGVRGTFVQNTVKVAGFLSVRLSHFICAGPSMDGFSPLGDSR